MIRFLPRFGREDKPRRRPSPRRFQAAVDSLEGRDLLTLIVGTAHASPPILWPPNGRFVQVTVTGTAFEQHWNGHTNTFNVLPGPKIGQFHVTDEYRQNNPTGTFSLTHTYANNFTFSFTVDLQAKRATEFAQGRRYYVSIGLRDIDGWFGKTIAVWVPKSLPSGFSSTQVAALQRSHR